MPISLFACLTSLVIHVTVFATGLIWSRANTRPDSRPRILLPRGAQAPRVKVMLVKAPDPPEPDVSPLPSTESDSIESTDAIENEPPPKPVQVPRPDEAPSAPDPVDHAMTPPTVEKERPTHLVAPEPMAETPPPDRKNATEKGSEEPSPPDPHESPSPTTMPPPDTRPAPAPDAAADATRTANEESDKKRSDDSSAAPPALESPDDSPSGVETGVEILNVPKPRYPRLSRRRGEQGVVLLDIEVHADGTVGTMKVVQEPGFPLLVEAAIEAAKKARFKPALRNGQPVRGEIRVPFRFVLK